MEYAADLPCLEPTLGLQAPAQDGLHETCLLHPRAPATSSSPREHRRQNSLYSRRRLKIECWPRDEETPVWVTMACYVGNIVSRSSTTRSWLNNSREHEMEWNSKPFRTVNVSETRRIGNNRIRYKRLC